MGCPDIYYIKALQFFAHSLNYYDNKSRATEMLGEKNEETLEKEIIKLKEKLPEKTFYFDAGRVVQALINDEDETNECEGLNDCLIGVWTFQKFIGLNDCENS